MGNLISHSSQRYSPDDIVGDVSHSSLSLRHKSRRHVPKHLKPLKVSRKLQKRFDVEHSSKPDDNEVALNINKDKPKYTLHHGAFHYSDVMSDPASDVKIDGIFRWFNGRRFHNKKGLACLLPNDKTELDRLRVQFYIFRWAFNGSTLITPTIEEKLQQGIKVLNLSCGPGIWTGHPIIDMALDYRKSHFTAVDICDLLPVEAIENDESQHVFPVESSTSTGARQTVSRSATPIAMSFQNSKHSQSPQSTSHNVTIPTRHPQITSLPLYESFHSCPPLVAEPSNRVAKRPLIPSFMPDPQCRPERTTKYSRGKRYLDNLEIHVCNIPYDGLPFEDNTFDFVQQNLSAIVYTRSDWSRMLAELIRVTKPGGYIQLMEVDYYIHHCRLEQDVWLEKVLRSIEDHFHVQPHIARQLDTLLKEAGMTEVDGRLVSIPFGAWGLDIGILWQQNVDNVVEAMKPFLSSLLNMDGSTYRDKWRATVDELEHAKAFHNVHISWGRKPFPQE